MGDRNQLTFLEEHARLFDGPYLEVGSKNYGSTQDLRTRFAGDYVGVDMETGPGVDAVCDLTQPLEEVQAALGRESFGSIFCLSVLEHCSQPFRMADNLSRLLRPGGRICVSVPFSWEFHGFPSDYWRFTHEGVRLLFPELEFPEEYRVSAAARDGDVRPIDEQVGKRILGTKHHLRAGNWARAISVAGLRACSALGLGGWALRYPYILAPTMITMVGQRPAAGEATSAA